MRLRIAFFFPVRTIYGVWPNFTFMLVAWWQIWSPNTTSDPWFVDWFGVEFLLGDVPDKYYHQSQYLQTKKPKLDARIVFAPHPIHSFLISGPHASNQHHANCMSRILVGRYVSLNGAISDLTPPVCELGRHLWTETSLPKFSASERGVPSHGAPSTMKSFSMLFLSLLLANSLNNAAPATANEALPNTNAMYGSQHVEMTPGSGSKDVIIQMFEWYVKP